MGNAEATNCLSMKYRPPINVKALNSSSLTVALNNHAAKDGDMVPSESQCCKSFGTNIRGTEKLLLGNTDGTFSTYY